MSRRPLTGRADLLLAMAGEDAVVADLARRLGFQRVMALPEPQQPELIEAEEASDPIDSELKLAPRPPVPWWRAQEFRTRKVIPTPLPEADDSNRLSNQFEATLSRFDPLATQPEILTRLRQVTDLTRPGSRIDVDRVVYELSRGRQLARFPRLNRRSWGQDLHVVIDRARYLVPYWRDQKIVGQAIKRLLPKGGGTICMLHEGAEIPVIQWPDDQRGEELRPRPGATILALSDLGSMQDANFPAAERRWMRMGKKLQDQECAALALVPCRPDAIPNRLARLWTVIPWERYSGHSGKPTDAVTVETCERILALLSAAVRIEPRLLRAVRKLLPAGRRDPGLEARVWQKCHGTMHCSAAALSQEQTVEFREALLRDALNQEAWALIEVAHREEYAGVGCLEVLRLGKHIGRLGAEDRTAESRRWFQRIGTGATEFGGDFFYKAATQLTPEAWEAAPELHVLWNRFCPDEAAPKGYDPALARVEGGTLQMIRVSLVGDRLEYRRRGEVPERSSPLAVVRLTNPEIMVDSFDHWPADDAAADSFWRDGIPPDWADRWGRDAIGPWVEFVVGEARQRMRWIPPGTFLMGSPFAEPGCKGDEGPQHLVTLNCGYWLFDTPCTQMLWEAVMDVNPSHFKGAHRPVERVSWVGCQEFLSRINDRCPGVELKLPTEAEWEYACRAGTATVTYAGDGELEAIAWYDKNSGETTHDVGELAANGWGVYDMFGNVWEWCRDQAGREYSCDPVVDPVYDRGEPSAYRVIRGGSWFSPAQYVRAAYRHANDPSLRDGNLGFRCSSSGSEPSEGGQRPTDASVGRRPELVRSQRAVRGRRPTAEPAGDSESAIEDRRVRIATRDAEYSSVPQGPIVRIRTDLEDVFLCQTRRPGWANRTGRDQYGLWAEFAVRQKGAKDVVQRIRWIPPGRFLMGSPESESGRFAEEGPQTEATVEEGFWLFDTPCRQELWTAVTGDNPSQFKGPKRPVENVPWQDAIDFTMKLSNLVMGLHFQLPSETQWEYACRAGSEATTYAGDFDPDDSATQDQLQRIAWYSANAGGMTHDVAALHPNVWGLYDMLGNVWEWCQDPWCDRYNLPRQEHNSSSARVFRGGGWVYSARSVRAACRLGYHPGGRGHNLGFRCSCSEGEPGGGDTEPERSGRSRRGAGEDSATKSDESWLKRLQKALWRKS